MTAIPIVEMIVPRALFVFYVELGEENEQHINVVEQMSRAGPEGNEKRHWSVRLRDLTVLKIGKTEVDRGSKGGRITVKSTYRYSFCGENVSVVPSQLNNYILEMIDPLCAHFYDLSSDCV